RMTQLEIALLLHPIDEVVVFLDVGAEQRLLGVGILDDDEVPRLAVGAGHRPPPDFEDSGDVIVGDRIRLELAHACARLHEIEQDIVVTGKIGLIHRSSRLKPTPKTDSPIASCGNMNLTPFHSSINRCGLGTSSRSTLAVAIRTGAARMLGEAAALTAGARAARRPATAHSRSRQMQTGAASVP